MFEFMEYLNHVFFKTIEWEPDNFYVSLMDTSNGILKFRPPTGLQVSLSSLPTASFGNSYTFRSFQAVSGKLEYLYSSRPLAGATASRSADADLSRLVHGYREPAPLKPIPNPSWAELASAGWLAAPRDSLYYSCLHAPGRVVDALLLRRLSPSKLLEVRVRSDPAGPVQRGSTALTLHSNTGKYSSSLTFLPDSGLVQLSGLYNFGPDPRIKAGQAPLAEPGPLPLARLSVGGEFVYKPGVPVLSIGMRLSTLPPYTSLSSSPSSSSPPPSSSSSAPSTSPSPLPSDSTFPYTMTLVMNPIIGRLLATYAVQAGPNVVLGSKFNFNVFSYRSSVVLGAELWRRECRPEAAATAAPPSPSSPESELQPPSAASSATANPRPAPASGRPSPTVPNTATATATAQPALTASPAAAGAPTTTDPGQLPPVTAVLKARINQDLRCRFLYEKRFHGWIVSVGATVDLRAPFVGGPAPAAAAAAAAAADPSSLPALQPLATATAAPQTDPAAAANFSALPPRYSPAQDGEQQLHHPLHRPYQHHHHHHHHNPHQHQHQHHRSYSTPQPASAGLHRSLDGGAPVPYPPHLLGARAGPDGDAAPVALWLGDGPQARSGVPRKPVGSLFQTFGIHLAYSS